MQKCMLCHTAINVPKQFQSKMNDLKKEITYYVSLVDRIRFVRDLTYDLDKENSSKKYRHNHPFVMKIGNNFGIIDENVLNYIFCKEHNKEYNNTLKKLKEYILLVESTIIFIEDKKIFDEKEIAINEMMLSISKHIHHKLEIIIPKMEKLRLLTYLNEEYTNYIFEDFKLVNNSNKQKIKKVIKHEELKRFQALKNQPISPNEFLNFLPAEILEDITPETLFSDDNENKYFSIIYRHSTKEVIIMCRYGYFNLILDKKDNIKEVSEQFSLNLDKLKKELYYDNSSK